VSQASTRNANGSTTSVLVFGCAQNQVTGANPVVSYKLYRGNTATGPFSLQTDLEIISPFSIVTQLYDNDPEFGVEHFYVATAIDSKGLESAPSNVLYYTASLVQIGLVAGSFSPAARGSYPLLGCDVFIDPTTKEGVVGPNGDLLTVNGLECLAQDLRLRILTDIGELTLHPTYGLSKSQIIGSGQAKAQVQAQLLRVAVIDCIRQDPRVYSVIDVTVSQTNYDSWIIAYTIMAINVEDALRANMVYPYNTLATAA
jgi:hypothetical protein